MLTKSNTPTISVVVATYNSASKLPKLFQAIDKQSLHLGDISFEVLLIDGGSSDDTRELGTKLGGIVIDNPEGNAIYAKHIGINVSKGRYVCFLDHDEIISSITSFENRIQIFRKHEHIRAILSSGYLLEKEVATSNWYASEFGDPYSLFRYRFPNSYPFRVNSLANRMKQAWSDEQAVGLVVGSEKSPLLLELVAAATFIDKEYFINTYPEIKKQDNLVPHLYSLVAEQSQGYDEIAIMKNDFLIHDSVDSWATVVSKIQWRVSNAANKFSPLSSAGLAGRLKYEKQHFSWFERLRISQLGFVIYCLLVIPLAADAISFSITRKRFGYLMHIPLAYFVLFRGFISKLMELLKITPTIKRYDGSA